MEKIIPSLIEQFCDSMEFASFMNYIDLHRSLQGDLQFHKYAEKWEYIKSKRIEIREKLEGYNYKTAFSIKGIEEDLFKCLENYYKRHSLIWAKKVEYSNSLVKGKYSNDILTGVFTVNSKPWYSGPWYHGRAPQVDFSKLDEYKPLVQYIAWGLLFLELNRLDTIYSGENINDQENELHERFILAEKLVQEYKREYLCSSNLIHTNLVQIEEDKELLKLMNTPQTDIDKNGNIYTFPREDTPCFSQKFCDDIQNAVKLKSDWNLTILNHKLDILDDNKKKEYIEQEQIDVSKKINGSDEKFLFHIPYARINTNLTECLDLYFSTLLISSTNEVKYDQSLEYGTYKYDDDDNLILIVPPVLTGYYYTESFDFSRFDEFQPLLEYIARCKLLVELDRLKVEFKEGKIVHEEKAHYTDQELDEYFQSWIDGSVRQEDWKKFYRVDVIENLKNYDISEEQWDDIRQHRFVLFCKISDNILKNRFIDPFNEQILLNNGIQIAKRDLLLINDLIVGNIDEIKAVRIKKVLGISDCKKAIEMLEDVLRNRYSDDENFDLCHEKSHLQITAIINYKKFLENYLNDQNEKPHVILPNLIEKNIIASQDKSHQLNELEITSQEEKKEELNTYQRIFKDPKAIELFEFLLDKFGGKEVNHADCSFIFRQMQSDHYINDWVKESEFRDFLPKAIVLDKLKTLNNWSQFSRSQYSD